jgi:hypothetical protein
MSAAPPEFAKPSNFGVPLAQDASPVLAAIGETIPDPIVASALGNAAYENTAAPYETSSTHFTQNFTQLRHRNPGHLRFEGVFLLNHL